MSLIIYLSLIFNKSYSFVSVIKSVVNLKLYIELLFKIIMKVCKKNKKHFLYFKL